MKSLFSSFSRTITVVLMVVMLGLLIWLGPPVLMSLVADWPQLMVAIVAASVMFAIGRALTLGRGVLAGASQYDKLLVWSALGMSVVSAVTTSTGLQQMLSANQSTAPLVPVMLALLLAVSIQAYMLNNALRIGEGLQKLAPKDAVQDEEDLHEQYMAEAAAASDKPSKQWQLLLAIVVLLVGIAVALNSSFQDFFDMIRRAFISAEAATGINPVGLVVAAGALLMLHRFGFLTAMGTVAGLTTSLFIYIAMLLFSSGFGYMFYFNSVQTEVVQATDRNAFIRNNAPALVNKIISQTEADVAKALIDTREGEAFESLSARMDQLAAAFRDANEEIRAAQVRWEIRREEQLQRQREASERLENARTAVATVEGNVIAAERARDTQQPIIAASIDRLIPQLQEAIRLRDAELTGVDVEGATGVAGIGPEYRERDREAQRIQTEIDRLNVQLSELAANVTAAQASLDAANSELQRVQSNDGEIAEDDSLRPAVVDAQSFVEPLTEYLTKPDTDTLLEVARACSDGVQILINAGVDPENRPTCDVAAVEADVLAWKRAQAALDELVKDDQTGACDRTEEELAADREGRRNVGQASLNEIPEFLQARIDWVVRCVDAANTGSEEMAKIVAEVERLESEYLTPTYDVRRIIGALTSFNRFAVFSALLAVVVDTAILFAGIGANAQRGRELGENHKKVVAFRQADRVRNQLLLVDPEEPGRVAVQLLDMAKPETHTPGHESPFSHQIALGQFGQKQVNQIKRIMTAAGTDFARLREVDGQKRWYLHANLIALLTEIAGSTRPDSLAADYPDLTAVPGSDTSTKIRQAIGGPAGSQLGRRRLITTLPNFSRASKDGDEDHKPPRTPNPGPAEDPFNE
ncbi:MAG: hypothetical protein QNJ09_17110 [Paracoccaceae bacterium]|nr:hypothetical protein [Paracoccaceae bacterium]